MLPGGVGGNRFSRQDYVRWRRTYWIFQSFKMRSP
jgi:hypothetical protein